MLSLPTVFQLIGPPATGKLTIARALVNRVGSGIVLLDNHTFANPILRVVGADGATPVPSETWSYAGMLKEVVLEAAEVLSPPHFSFVFTNYFVAGAGAEESFARTTAFADRRGALLIPVLVECGQNELCRRVAAADRRAHSKLTDPGLLLDLLERPAFVPTHPNLLRVSSQTESPDSIADRILSHATACATSVAPSRFGTMDSR